MASQPIIHGALVDAPGRYELCWIMHTEAGEVQATTRNVVVSQHGPWFYLQFADESFQPYPCGHEGLRCDLLDPSVAWLRPVALELSDEQEIVQSGDFANEGQLAPSWVGQKIRSLLLSGYKVYRPVRKSGDNEPTSAVIGAADVGPGLQATG